MQLAKLVHAGDAKQRIAEEDLVVNERKRKVAIQRYQPKRELAHFDGHVIDVGTVETVCDYFADGTTVQIAAMGIGRILKSPCFYYSISEIARCRHQKCP